MISHSVIKAWKKSLNNLNFGMNKASREKSSEDTKKGKSTSFYN